MRLHGLSEDAWEDRFRDNTAKPTWKPDPNIVYGKYKYIYKGYIVEKLATSGLPNPSGQNGGLDCNGRECSYSYWTVHKKADQYDINGLTSKEIGSRYGPIAQLPIDKVPVNELAELDRVIVRFETEEGEYKDWSRDWRRREDIKKAGISPEDQMAIDHEDANVQNMVKEIATINDWEPWDLNPEEQARYDLLSPDEKARYHAEHGLN